MRLSNVFNKEKKRQDTSAVLNISSTVLCQSNENQITEMPQPGVIKLRPNKSVFSALAINIPAVLVC